MSVRAPTLGEALLPIVVLLVCLIAGGLMSQLTVDILLASILLAAAAAGVIANRHGAGWAEIQRSTGDKIAAVLPAILILLAIGTLIGSWMAAGTIPFMVGWGLRLVSPDYLLLTAFAATAVMSLATGTSWGSAGTIGVAFVGIGAAMGAQPGAVAGAVVSGAYLGDKLSPLSDTTNVSALAAGSPLYVHIGHMLWTSIPSAVLALLLYTVAGSSTDSVAALSGAGRFLADLEWGFDLSPIVLVPVVVVIWGIIRGTPPALAMALSSLTAMVVGVFAQGFSVAEVLAAAITGFRAELLTSAGGWSPGPEFVALVERGGMYSMASTLVVIIAAFLLAGAMDVSGSLDLLVSRLLSAARSIFTLVAATMATGGAMIALTSHAGVTALVTGSLYQQAYRDRGVAPQTLSRSIEDSVTITEPLMPWTVSGVFMATTLGVPTAAYAPWAVFCYGGPLFSLLVAALYSRSGRGIARLPGAPASGTAVGAAGVPQR